jgi:hypothetical protein
MKLRGFSENTIFSYSIQCNRFLDFSKARDTSRLTEKEFRAYLVHLTSRDDLAPSSTNLYNCAVRFLYKVTLEKDLNYNWRCTVGSTIRSNYLFLLKELVRNRGKSVCTTLQNQSRELWEAA